MNWNKCELKSHIRLILLVMSITCGLPNELVWNFSQVLLILSCAFLRDSSQLGWSRVRRFRLWNIKRSFNYCDWTSIWEVTTEFSVNPIPLQGMLLYSRLLNSTRQNTGFFVNIEVIYVCLICDTQNLACSWTELKRRGTRVDVLSASGVWR